MNFSVIKNIKSNLIISSHVVPVGVAAAKDPLLSPPFETIVTLFSRLS